MPGITTRTQIQTQAPTIPLVLRVVAPSERLTPTEKLKALLEEMRKASPSAEVSQYISKWEENYFENFQPTSALDVKKREAATALCFLLTNIESDLPDFVDRLKALIQETLPQGCDAGQFIYAYKLKEASFLLNELEDKLYARANGINEEAAARFEILRAQLLALNADREMNAIQLYQRLDVVNRNINQLVLDLKRIHQGMQQVEHKMETQERALQGSLDKCEQVLKKV